MTNPLAGRRVLVTGAGGPAGVAVIRALHRMGVHTAGADCDPMSAGLLLADDATVVPRLTDPAYLGALDEALAAFGCDGLISTMSEELVVLAPHASRFAANGVSTWFPPGEAVAACIDKWRFAAAMAAGEVPSPQTALGEVSTVPGPWVVKPRFGRGSQHVYRTTHLHLMPALLELCPDPIVQSMLPGREFTADCLVDRDGTVLAVVPRWRTETRGGISTKGSTFVDERVDLLVRQAVSALGLHGPCNVQGFVDTEGPARIVEVNPRFSGALPLSLAAGADLVGQFVRGMYGFGIEPERLSAKPGVGLVRYFEDLIVAADQG